MREAKKRAAADPLGKVVTVKSRGDTKPGGRAKVCAVSTVKVLAEELTFYTVEYVHDGTAEPGIEKKFVVFDA